MKTLWSDVEVAATLVAVGAERHDFEGEISQIVQNTMLALSALALALSSSVC